MIHSFLPSAYFRNGRLFAATGILAVALSGCASQGGASQADFDAVNDPFEDFNRASFKFNQGLDKVFFKPLAQAYLKIPEDGRDSVDNLIAHYSAAVSLANAMMQGNRERTGDVLGRFLVNTTIGIGGLFDPASFIGIPRFNEDFGQTLAVWGMESGPYLVLPIFGPSNVRDALGRGPDVFLDPLTYVFGGQNFQTEAGLIRSSVSGVAQRANVMEALDAIEKTSLDFYATIRSLSRQRRANEIDNGTTGPVNAPGPSHISKELKPDFPDHTPDFPDHTPDFPDHTPDLPDYTPEEPGLNDYDKIDPKAAPSAGKWPIIPHALALDVMTDPLSVGARHPR